ncbi:MAG TPA: Rid family hydrolase [Vicinamibacterales bacterium]|nr:Rid family hydrolase [Vicinamibacterales bacterium]
MRRLHLLALILPVLIGVEALGAWRARAAARPLTTALPSDNTATDQVTTKVVDHFDASPTPAAGGTAQSPRRKRVIQPPDYKPTPSPLSPGILVGDTLYLSGSTGGDPVSGQLVKGGFEPEMRQIMSNVQTVLAAADMTLSDVVSVTAYLADMGDFARFNEIYKEFFTATPLPTRSTVAVKGLARDARLELTMTAVRAR